MPNEEAVIEAVEQYVENIFQEVESLRVKDDPQWARTLGRLVVNEVTHVSSKNSTFAERICDTLALATTQQYFSEIITGEPEIRTSFIQGIIEQLDQVPAPDTIHPLVEQHAITAWRQINQKLTEGNQLAWAKNIGLTLVHNLSIFSWNFQDHFSWRIAHSTLIKLQHALHVIASNDELAVECIHGIECGISRMPKPRFPRD